MVNTRFEVASLIRLRSSSPLVTEASQLRWLRIFTFFSYGTVMACVAHLQMDLSPEGSFSGSFSV